jgi:hypothetical protein
VLTTFKTQKFELWKLDEVQKIQEVNIYYLRLWATTALVFGIFELSLEFQEESLYQKCFSLGMLFLAAVFLIPSYCKESKYAIISLFFLQIH